MLLPQPFEKGTYAERANTFYNRNGVSKTLKCGSERISSLKWSCEGKYLAGISRENKAVRIWTPLSNSQNGFEGIVVVQSRDSSTLSGHTDPLEDVTWKPTSAEQLASSAADKTLRLWDVKSMREAILKPLMAAACWKESLHLFGTDGQCHTTMALTSIALNLTWSPCGHYIAVGNKADQLLILDVRKAGKDVTAATVASRDIGAELNELAWHPDTGHLYAATGSVYGTGLVQIFDIKKTPLTSAHSLLVHTNTTTCIKFGPKLMSGIHQRVMATGGADAIVAIHTVSELACARTFTNVNTPIRHITFGYDGRVLAYAGEDGYVDMVDAKTGQQVMRVRTGQASACAFSPTKAHFAYAIDDVSAKGERTVGVTVIGLDRQASSSS